MPDPQVLLRARIALASWDDRDHRGLYLDRAMAVAEALRRLLAEVDTERLAAFTEGGDDGNL